MARKRTLSRLANRSEYDEETPKEEVVEEQSSDDAADDDTGTATKPKKKKAATPRATTTRSRSRSTKQPRLRAFWGVFDQAGKEVQRFSHREREAAEAWIAEKMTAEKKPILYVQLIKEEFME